MDVLALNGTKARGICNVSLAKRGDKEAFITLINENKLTLYRVAKGMLHNTTDIEDSIQNTIVKAYENINSLRNDHFFNTWLVKILINQCNLIIKSYKKTVVTDNTTTSGAYFDSYKDFDLSQALHSLSDDLRAVTVMYYYLDMAQGEIAKALRIPEGTVKSRLSRAKEKLNNILRFEDS